LTSFLAVVVCVRSPFFRVKWLILPGQPVTPRKRYSILAPGSYAPAPVPEGRLGASEPTEGTAPLQLFVLAVITFGALILFATEKLRADLVAVMVAAALALTGLVTVEQAFAGFGSPAVVTVSGIFVMSAGLMRTGGSDHLTRLLRRLGGRGERRLIAATVLLVGLLSSIMNNIGAAIIMMPAVLAAGRDAKVPAGR